MRYEPSPGHKIGELKNIKPEHGRRKKAGKTDRRKRTRKQLAKNIVARKGHKVCFFSAAQLKIFKSCKQRHPW